MSDLRLAADAHQRPAAADKVRVSPLPGASRAADLVLQLPAREGLHPAVVGGADRGAPPERAVGQLLQLRRTGESHDGRGVRALRVAAVHAGPGAGGGAGGDSCAVRISQPHKAPISRRCRWISNARAATWPPRSRPSNANPAGSTTCPAPASSARRWARCHAGSVSSRCAVAGGHAYVAGGLQPAETAKLRPAGYCASVDCWLAAIIAATTSATSTSNAILIQLHGRDPAMRPVTPLTAT